MTMNGNSILKGCGLAVLGVVLVALPGPAQKQSPGEGALVRAEKALREAEARLREGLGQKTLQEAERTIEDREDVFADADVDLELDNLSDKIEVFSALGEGGSWLGVEIHEVTADNVKELKLSAERGVLLSEIVPDSPAAKVGLKANDVVVEVNGQRIEGTAQFRRMIREVPVGRAVQLTVWREGKTQTFSVTLGKAEERRHAWTQAFPSRDFVFRMPDLPQIPHMEWNGGAMFIARPKLGIDAEDLDGQLGSYFGAPDGEGVLVRGVNAGSPAEKAGLKAGDVIVKLDGERIRTVGDLREKLAEKREKKTVNLSVLRNRSEISVSVEVEQPKTPKPRKLIGPKTNI
jgi:serine protease Do